MSVQETSGLTSEFVEDGPDGIREAARFVPDSFLSMVTANSRRNNLHWARPVRPAHCYAQKAEHSTNAETTFCVNKSFENTSDAGRSLKGLCTQLPGGGVAP